MQVGRCLGCLGQCLSEINMPKCAILKVHLKAILKMKEKSKSKLGLLRVTMRLDKSLNQSLKCDLEKISYMNSNGPLEKCCKVLNKHLIIHVLGGQNRGSTNCILSLV